MAHEPVRVMRPAGTIPHATVTSTAGAAAEMTLAPGTGLAIHVGSVHWSYSAAPTGGGLTLTDGTTAIDFHITAAGPGSMVFDPALRFAAGATVTATLAGGGGAVVGKITQISAWKTNTA